MWTATDWLDLPLDHPCSSILRGVPGFRIDKRKMQIHRTHLPLLPEVCRAGLTPPTSPVDPAPDGLLRPYQDEARQFCSTRHGTLLNLFLGAGKSRTALSVVSGRGIIVAPLVTWSVWLKELSILTGSAITTYEDGKWSSPDDRTFVVNFVRGYHKKAKPLLADADVYLVNPELISQRLGDLMSLDTDWAIFDEAHLYVSRKSQRQNAAAVLANTVTRCIALTGTPILSHLADLYGILQVVCPSAFGSWTDFVLAYAGGRPGEFGLVLGEPSRQDEFTKRFSEVAFTRSWDEVSNDIPPITREQIPVVPTPAQQREYDILANDIRSVLRLLERATLNGAEAMAQVNALRRCIGRIKIDAVVNLIKTVGEPVVVWTWHRDVATAIAAKTDGLVVTGEEPRTVRDARLDAFRKGQSSVLVATMASAGVGVDLTNARITIQAELSWTGSDMTQAEGRVFRSGQTRPCITYWLLAANTVEDRIVNVLWQKAGMATAAGSRAESKLLGGIVGTRKIDVDITTSVLAMLERSFPSTTVA